MSRFQSQGENRSNHLLTESKQRVLYFDLLRIAATFIVIMLHISGINFYNLDYNSFQWNIQNIFDGVSRWGVGIFVMISGGLFLGKEITIHKLYGKYIKRIVMVYFFWSFVYSLIFNFLKGGSLVSFLLDFINGHYHLWFLCMIVGLYMIIPFLNNISKDEKLLRYFIYLGFVFAFCIPQIISIITIISPEIGDWSQKVVNHVHFYFVLGYPVYFLLGYYMRENTLSVKLQRIINVFGIISFVITVVGNVVLSHIARRPVSIFFENDTINVLFEALFVFNVFKKHFGNIIIKCSNERIIKEISKLSFGAYLIHAAVITVLTNLFNTNVVNPLVGIPFLSIVVCIVSYVLSAVMNIIPGIRKMV